MVCHALPGHVPHEGSIFSGSPFLLSSDGARPRRSVQPRRADSAIALRPLRPPRDSRPTAQSLGGKTHRASSAWKGTGQFGAQFFARGAGLANLALVTSESFVASSEFRATSPDQRHQTGRAYLSGPRMNINGTTFQGVPCLEAPAHH